MKTISNFKSANKGRLFILKLKDDSPTLLSFNSTDELKEYVFSSEDSKRALFNKVTATPSGHIFLNEQAPFKDIDQLEHELLLYADKYSLIETIGHGQDEFLVIDTDELDPAYWKDLQNSKSHLYPADDNRSFAIISKLINEG